MRRRSFLAGCGAAVVLGACKTGARESRCKRCGMKIDRASAWRAEIVSADGSRVLFDAPRCALSVWTSSAPSGAYLEVQEYYDRTARRADSVRFAVGSDVLGPMGPDMVPVDPARIEKFAKDHAATRVLRLDEITSEVLASLK
jgi:copper chaperone NosL